LPHTHRRFNSKDGTVPTPVAATFAQLAGTPASPTSTPSTVKPTVVDIADTAP
jgi:hypothetical protein